MNAEEGWRCEGDAAPGPYSTSTARMLLPGTFGNSRSKTFDTFAAGVASCAATFADNSEAPASSSTALFFMVTLLLMTGSGGGACPIGKACRSSNELARRGKAILVEDRSEVLRSGIGNDLPLVAHVRQKQPNELGHAAGFDPIEDYLHMTSRLCSGAISKAALRRRSQRRFRTTAMVVAHRLMPEGALAPGGAEAPLPPVALAETPCGPPPVNCVLRSCASRRC